MESFDPKTCKDVLDVDELKSWSITYWSHSWNEEKSHDKGQLSAISASILREKIEGCDTKRNRATIIVLSMKERLGKGIF